MAERPGPDHEKYLPLVADWMKEAAAMDRAELEYLVVSATIDKRLQMDGLGEEEKLLAAEMLSRIVETLKRERARAGGIASHQKDPKKAAVQSAKFQVRARWEEWRAKPALYESKVQFADAMLDEHPLLSSQKKIMDWTRDWEKAAKR